MSNWKETDIKSIRTILEEDPYTIFEPSTLEEYDLEYVDEIRDEVPGMYHQRAMVVLRGIGEGHLYGFYMWHGMGKHQDTFWPGQYDDTPDEIFLVEEKVKTIKSYEKL